ncbi:MAG: TonB-dependent receptor [Pseudomonadota bacterium]
MFKHTVLSAALAAAFAISLAMPFHANAAEDRALTEIRAQIEQMKRGYESRLQALEKRLQEAESKNAAAQVQVAATPQAVPVPGAAPQLAAAPTAPGPGPAPIAAARSSGFNPSIALNLSSTAANLSQDPEQYRLQGFLPTGGEVGPGKRGFSLGESEITMSANIDPQFAGQLTFALTPEDTVGVEEAFVKTTALSNGFNAKAGRFLSSIGYLNSIHAHAWDFVDAPLTYQAFFGGQYKPDGVQVKWLAPTEKFVELGVEVGSGSGFPGSGRRQNGFGNSAVFAHLGDDIGDSASWRAGLSYMRNTVENRSYDDSDSSGATVSNAFSGKSGTWVADAVYKWSPNGNASQRNFKLQGEYFRRTESGTLDYDTQGQSLGAASGGFDSVQSGWYLQGIYQFMPQWRAGLRYERLSSGTQRFSLVDNGSLSAADFPALAAFSPSRSSVMFDYAPSEFSRFRLQLARDQSSPGVIDQQVFLQYIMSLGTHSAHNF